MSIVNKESSFQTTRIHYDNHFHPRRFNPMESPETSEPVEGMIPFSNTPETSAPLFELPKKPSSSKKSEQKKWGQYLEEIVLPKE